MGDMHMAVAFLIMALLYKMMKYGEIFQSGFLGSLQLGTGLSSWRCFQICFHAVVPFK